MRLLAFLVCGILAALSAPAGAQSYDGPQCRQECSAGAGERSGQTRAVQSCLARCAVRQGVIQQQQEEARSRPRGRAPAPQPLPVAAPPPGPTRYYGTIYTAPPPGTGVGITVGQADRMLAHRTAETECMAQGGAPCRLVTEFTFACAAVAHGVRQSPGTAIMTSDPSTFRLHAVGHGMANTQADAEYDVISDCNRRDRGLTCGIVRSECSGR